MKQDKVALFILFPLWVASLFLTGLTMETSGALFPFKGYEILYLGWAGMFDGTLAWFANPLLLISWFWFRRDEADMKLIAAVVSFGLGLTAFNMKTSTNFETGHEDIVHLMVGYYVWMGVILLYGLYSGYFYSKSLREQKYSGVFNADRVD